MSQNKVLDGLMGLCVADALGVPVEFTSREVLKKNPVTDMRGYGTYNQPPGTWSDDSSLAFCLAESLINGLNYNDIADKFVRWLYEGYWTPYGDVFDVGTTTSEAIMNLRNGIEPTKAGPDGYYNISNGSLMRILPLAFYLQDKDIKTQFEVSHDVSRITHGHPRVLVAVAIYIQYAINLLKGQNPKEAYQNMQQTVLEYYSNHEFAGELKHFDRILHNDISTYPEDEIQSTGYAVASLEAALWAFLNSKDYADAALKAVNLGDDTDTVGAIAGGLAGIYYGYENIPKKWIALIPRKDDIIDLANRLNQALNK